MAPVQRLSLGRVHRHWHLAELLRGGRAARKERVKAAARAEHDADRAGQRDERAARGHPPHSPQARRAGRPVRLRHRVPRQGYFRMRPSEHVLHVPSTLHKA